MLFTVVTLKFVEQCVRNCVAICIMPSNNSKPGSLKMILKTPTSSRTVYSQNGCSFDGNFANFLRNIGI